MHTHTRVHHALSLRQTHMETNIVLSQGQRKWRAVMHSRVYSIIQLLCDPQVVRRAIWSQEGGLTSQIDLVFVNRSSRIKD